MQHAVLVSHKDTFQVAELICGEIGIVLLVVLISSHWPVDNHENVNKNLHL